MSGEDAALEPPETVLIVDDEDPVRRTFREWLEGARLGVRVLAAADAETALALANEQPIDLAVLDWNLGAGNNGLQLLEDLAQFHPDIVAIMVTAYAHQATPLQAMRMGVRDYLDKNTDLDRSTFLAAVRRQLERLRPARRERRLHARLVAFREAVTKVLPLVQSAATLTDPLSPPEAVAGLFRFLLRVTGARGGVLLVRSHDPERVRAYGDDGQALPPPAVPFARSLAAAVVGLGQARAWNRPAEDGGVELDAWERGRRSLLAVPLPAGPDLQAVVELFDSPRPDGFGEEDRKLVDAAAALGGEVLRQALAERHTQALLIDAIAAALRASDSLSDTLQGSERQRLTEPPPRAVLEQLEQGLTSTEGVAAGEAVRLAEAIRVLALRHGPAALNHCLRLVEGVRGLLDEVTGAAEASSPRG